MCYCKHEKSKHYKTEIDEWREGCDRYLKNEDSWKYNFDYEFTKVDCEQSILSQLVFIRLFEKLFNDCKANMETKRSIKIKYKDIEKEFLFDVMNNPKTGQPFNNAKTANIKLDFYELYHTIGNFAPIPKTITSYKYGPYLQQIHFYLNELWPWFLKFLKDNWREFPTEIFKLMSFEEYIIYTSQQMYISRIFDKVYCNYNNYINLTNENKNNKKSQIDIWAELINLLSHEKINETDTIISFNKLFANNDIKEIDKQIKFLIELRGRYIISILTDNKNTKN